MLATEIRRLADELETIYPQHRFFFHCYQRIAYDRVIGEVWRNKYQNFSQQATETEKRAVIQKLEQYRTDEAQLLADNEFSLRARGKWKEA